jgi:tetratricopeptide (TPR) repeat protein
MYGFTHLLQGWNDCGPANITQALSYYGWTQDQSVAAAWLKPDAEDKNVGPAEMVAFVNTQTQVRAVTRIGGDLTLLKTFIANDIPVLIETSYMPEGNDWLGHYQTLVGYDDSTHSFAIYDTWINAGPAGGDLIETYSDLDSLWQAFDRVFIVVYRPDQEALVQYILGNLADLNADAQQAFDVAKLEAQTNPQNGFAWFNMGTALTRLQDFNSAATAFDRARQVGIPWRMLWYQFGPYEAYFNVGRYDDVMGLVQATLTNTTNIEEAYYWQGRVYQQQGNTQSARDSYSLALQKNPHFTLAQQALDSLNS